MKLVFYLVFLFNICISDGKILLLETSGSNEETEFGLDYGNDIGCENIRKTFLASCPFIRWYRWMIDDDDSDKEYFFAFCDKFLFTQVKLPIQIVLIG